MRMRKRIGCLLIFLVIGTFLAGCGKSSSNPFGPEENRSLYTKFDYGDETVYVIGHKSPDTDTVTSAIAMAKLLNELGINAKPAVAGQLNNESKFVLKTLGIEEPELLEDAAGKQLWLVDHSEYSQAVDGAEEARIVGICDHHGIGNVKNSELINVISGPVGSTSALIYREFVRCGVEISPEMAGVMLSGLLSDSGIEADSKFSFNRTSFNNLKELAGISDIDEYYESMVKARVSYEGYSDCDIYYNDYKEYECNEVHFCIGVVEVFTEDEVEAMAERMRLLIENEKANNSNDFLVYMVADVKHEKQIIGWNDSDYASRILEAAFEGYEGASFEAGHWILKPSAGRKKVVVPRIEEAIMNY